MLWNTPCVPSLGFSMGCWKVQGQTPLVPEVEWLDWRKDFKLMHSDDLWYCWREEFQNSASRGAMKSASRGTKFKIWFRNNLRAKPRVLRIIKYLDKLPDPTLQLRLQTSPSNSLDPLQRKWRTVPCLSQFCKCNSISQQERCSAAAAWGVS